SLDNILAVGVREGHSPFDNDTPVRRLAAIVGQAAEQWGHVTASVECLERDRMVAEFVKATLVTASIGSVCTPLPPPLGHLCLPSRLDCESGLRDHTSSPITSLLSRTCRHGSTRRTAVPLLRCGRWSGSWMLPQVLSMRTRSIRRRWTT